MYLQMRRRLWYALHTIPKDARATLGKARFVKSLKTGDLKTAEQRAALLKAEWLSAIDRARRGAPVGLDADYGFWREARREAGTAERELIDSLFADELDRKVYYAAERAGIADQTDPRFGELDALAEAGRAYDYVTGRAVPFAEYLEEYLAAPGQIGLKPKTLDQRRTTIARFAEAFPLTRDVHRKDVQRHVNGWIRDGAKRDTVNRALSELRGYWKYLQTIDAAPEDALPFHELDLPRKPKGQRARSREAFTAEEVVALLNAASSKGDRPLADLIRLGMWTGARIEELCALKAEHAAGDALDIVDSKTRAGVRAVPIHPKLRATMARLVRDSTDGYVVSGLSFNKYSDRSNAIGKRFGRLKRDQGFSGELTFHSIRHTVATLLDNAGVPDHHVADIVGHADRGSFTMNTYSGGGAPSTLREALERIDYPDFPG